MASHRPLLLSLVVALAAGEVCAAHSQETATESVRPPVIGVLMIQRTPPTQEDTAFASFVGRVRDAVRAALQRNPNVVHPADAYQDYLARVNEEDELLLPSDVHLDTEYWIAANMLGRASATPTPENGAGTVDAFDAILYLARPSTNEVLGYFPFESTEAEATTFAEIGVHALLGTLLEPNLGVLRIRANEPPSSVHLRSATGVPSESSQEAGLFTTYNLRGRTGVEMVSDPLLTGEYAVVAVFPDLPDKEETVAVRSREDAIVVFDTGRLGWSPDGVPRVAMVRLVGLGPNQVAYVMREGSEPSAAAYISRGANGRPVVEWTEAIERDQCSVGRTGDSVVFERLPVGSYLVRTWMGLATAVGKVTLLGPGAEKRIQLGAEAATLSLAGLPTRDGPGRLNLFWTPLGPPAGAALYVDDAFAGMAFDAGLVSVVGLDPGVHRVRIRAAGFAPMDRTVDVAADRETSVFLRLRASAATVDARPSATVSQR